ncbi:hypothetical protein AC578_1356 [Pseudocercospora eumusae]|uniref:Uncharacterized protein n=1 Tax=Pseudocercospora eumusae TaxID=321146 RepID=A0A139HUW8_9PEZI|nr:hypothetical protein AC578_1356 [Pseudocercospora eumusae]
MAKTATDHESSSSPSPPSRRRIFSLILQALLLLLTRSSTHPNTNTKLFKRAIHETLKFLEIAKKELEEDEEEEKGRDSKISRILAVCGEVVADGRGKLRLTLLRGLVEGLEREVWREEEEKKGDGHRQASEMERAENPLPGPGELIAVPAGSVSSYSRITRAPTVASIVESTCRRTMAAEREGFIDDVEASTTAEASMKDSMPDSGKAGVAGSEKSPRAGSKRSGRDKIVFARRNFGDSKQAASPGDDGEVSPRAQSAVTAPENEAAAYRSTRSRTRAAPSTSKQMDSARSQEDLAADAAEPNGSQMVEEKKTERSSMSTRGSKSSSGKRSERLSPLAVPTTSKGGEHSQKGQEAEVASISTRRSKSSKSSSSQAEVPSQIAEEWKAERMSTASRRSRSSRRFSEKRRDGSSAATVQTTSREGRTSQADHEADAVSIASHLSRTSKSSSLRAEVSSETAENAMKSETLEPRMQREQEVDVASKASEHLEPSECSFAKAWASAAAAQQPVAFSKPMEDMEHRKTSTRTSDRSGSSSRSLAGSGQRKDKESARTSLTSHVSSKSRRHRSSRSQHEADSKRDAVTRHASRHSSRSKRSHEVGGVEDTSRRQAADVLLSRGRVSWFRDQKGS